MGDKEKEADKLMKKGHKDVSPSLLDFRLKPDWEQAAPSFEKAATLYKQAKSVDKALEAYEQAATCQEKMGSLWHAGKHYENCAELCRQYDGKAARVVTYYQKASDSYCTAGKAVAAAEAMARGARAVEELDPASCIKMYLEALELYETDGKQSQGADTYRAAIAALIRASRYSEAAEQLMRFALACESTKATHSQSKAYLGAVVVHLYNQDGESAWAAFQDAMNVEAFADSDEAFLADALFTAYSSGSEEAVRKLVTERQGFRQLDNQVARLALKLPAGKFKQVSKDVAAAMGHRPEGEEEADVDEDVM